MSQARRAFSLTELLVSMAIIAVLLGLLLPLLSHARGAGYRAVCLANLRQLSIGWQSYLHDHKDTFPLTLATPEWNYGGASFIGEGADRRAMLALDRPLNRTLVDELNRGGPELALLFRCPADRGVFARGSTVRGRPGQSILHSDAGGNASCFDAFGTSYRANPTLMDSTLAGIDQRRRPLALHEIQVDPSRLLLTADSAWFFATSNEGDEMLGMSTRSLEASWHGVDDAGHMLAVDGSTRFVDFSAGQGTLFTLEPRPRQGK